MVRLIHGLNWYNYYLNFRFKEKINMHSVWSNCSFFMARENYLFRANWSIKLEKGILESIISIDFFLKSLILSRVICVHTQGLLWVASNCVVCTMDLNLEKGGGVTRRLYWSELQISASDDPRFMIIWK